MKVIDAKSLAPWVEHALRLSDLAEEGSFLMASDGRVKICLQREMKADLTKCMGQRIAILRTDTDYRMRILDTGAVDAGGEQ